MKLRNAVLSLVALMVLPTISFAQDPIAPIASLEIMYGETADDIFSIDTHLPLVMHSVEDAGGMFSEASVAILNENVDWDEQYVLVFAWGGSGSVSLSHALSEAMPPHATFTMHIPGLQTDDLCCHNHVYVLRNDVEWSFVRQ